MQYRVETVEPQAEAANLRDFTHDFFTFLGATVTQSGRKKQSPLAIHLPPELAGHFGRPALALCFHQRELGPGFELVTQGSRIFDRMVAYLEERGAMTYLQLPVRHHGSEDLLRAVRPTNAAITGLRMEEGQQLLFVFNWRITYRADDKREELFTVVIDEHGVRHTLAGETTAGEEGIDLTGLYGDAQPAPNPQSAEDQPQPPRLPPMTHLTRLAENARKYAIYYADVRCVSHEAEILPRLYKTLNRLTGYYQQQIEETYDSHDPTGEKRQALEEDLRRKIAEEVENHRLRVEVKLVSYAVVQTPIASAHLTLSDGKQETAIRIALNRYTGVLQRPCCHACGEATTDLAIDHNGHITCDNCIRQCATCLEIVCERCGVAPCPACGKENCDSCGQSCWACGERACAEHISTCPICGDAVCHRCQVECAHCGVRQCYSHLRADHVSAGQGGAELICADCAVRCAGCQQYSVHIGSCSASGQRFCEACLVTCARCSQRFGPGFYHLHAGWTYCSNCLVECPHCQTRTPATTPCVTCGEGCCESCGLICDVCEQLFCDRHALRAPICDHVLCAEHSNECHLCRGHVCPVCDPPCGICALSFCPADSATCEQCGQSYCRDCIRRSGLCDTCALLHREGVQVNLADEPCAADRQVAKLVRHYRWVRSANERYTIYVGYGALNARMVVVMDDLAKPPAVIAVRKTAPLDTLLRKFWR
jgi:hypothetical protein